MQVSHGKLIDIKPGFFIMIALYIFLFPLRWVLAWIIAAAFHELCHYLVLTAYKTRIFSVHIDFNGTTIATEHMPPKQELISALAGPLGGSLLVVFSQWLPCTAVCALVQSVYNLLPVYPLDGGRVLRCCVMGAMGERNAQMVCNLIEFVILTIILIVAVIAGFKWRIGLLPVVFAVLLIGKRGRLKIPCKQMG